MSNRRVWSPNVPPVTAAASRATSVRPRYSASRQQEATAEAREQLQQVGGAVPSRHQAPQIAHGRADVTRASSPTPHPRPRARRPGGVLELVLDFHQNMKSAEYTASPIPRGERSAGVGVGGVRPREPCAPARVSHARMGLSSCSGAVQLRATRPSVRFSPRN